MALISFTGHFVCFRLEMCTWTVCHSKFPSTSNGISILSARTSRFAVEFMRTHVSFDSKRSTYITHAHAADKTQAVEHMCTFTFIIWLIHIVLHYKRIGAQRNSLNEIRIARICREKEGTKHNKQLPPFQHSLCYCCVKCLHSMQMMIRTNPDGIYYTVMMMIVIVVVVNKNEREMCVHDEVCVRDNSFIWLFLPLVFRLSHLAKQSNRSLSSSSSWSSRWSSLFGFVANAFKFGHNQCQSVN